MLKLALHVLVDRESLSSLHIDVEKVVLEFRSVNGKLLILFPYVLFLEGLEICAKMDIL